MTISPELIATTIASVVAGAAGLALRGALASRTAQGERLGRLEKRANFEDGRRAGYAEGYAAGAENRARDGVK